MIKPHGKAPSKLLMKLSLLSYRIVFFLVLMLIICSCKSSLVKSSKNITLTDVNADLSAKVLYNRIIQLSKKGYAFGHQDAPAYGIGWKNNGKEFRSDVKDVAGDHPAVFGFELGHIELGHSINLDTVPFELMTRLIRKAHKKRAIITISWHPDNPVSGNSAWETTPAVKEILKGGSEHDKYRAWLAKLAGFFKGLQRSSNKSIPIVFRPYHEMNGSWFWWGSGHCTPDEFKRLWHQTVDILSEDFEVHNLLYCYATDAVTNKEEYLKYYPGDAYVDILGIDLYHKKTTEEYIELLQDNLTMLAATAKERSKPYALTEGGLEKVPIDNWWTEVLDRNIADKGLAWALFWRNAWPSHYYVPYIGQASSMDFKKYSLRPHVLFLKDLKNIK